MFLSVRVEHAFAILPHAIASHTCWKGPGLYKIDLHRSEVTQKRVNYQMSDMAYVAS